MQIQGFQNYSNQSFSGLGLQTFKNANKRIDVYKLTRNDSDFIDRALNIIKGQQFPKDSLAIGEGSNRNIFEKALKKVQTHQNSKTLVAIEDNKRIAGVLDIDDYADNEIKGMICLGQGKKDTRESLLFSAIKSLEPTNDETLSVVVKSANLSDTIKQLFNKFGFKSEGRGEQKQMFLEFKNFAKNTGKYSAKSDFKITNPHGTNDVPLTQVLKLDE